MDPPYRIVGKVINKLDAAVEWSPTVLKAPFFRHCLNFILMSFVSKNILIKFRGFFLKNFSFSDQALILIY